MEDAVTNLIFIYLGTVSVLQQAFIVTAAIVNSVETQLKMKTLGRRLLTVLSNGTRRHFNLRLKMFQLLLVFERYILFSDRMI
jgi:FMN phosphatase YigB (HAD superfamily)